ncbi:oligosaccharide flippase family protein [Polaribacter sp. R77954]|uniref:oligosaccharide flippase family protein n=1 Tax=Polaribacter sp. R77954 TaxID=3093870 RepID=UPI0037C9A26D
MLSTYWKRRKDNKIFSNYIYLLLIQGANFILPLIALPYLVITLESEKYGLVMVAQSLAVFFTIIVDFGFNISATREVSLLKEKKKKLSQFFWDVYSTKLILTVFSFLLLICLISFIDKFKAEPLVYIYSFGIVVGQAIFPTWFFQGIEKMKMITFINVAAKTFFTISIFFVVLKPDDFQFVPILNGLGYIISGLIGFMFSLKYVDFAFPKFNNIKKITKESFNLCVSNFAVNLYSSSNTLILGFFAGDAIAGIYASMEKLVIATKSIYVPLYQSIFPHLSTLSFKKIKKFTRKITIPIMISGVILSSVIIIGSESILKLIYKDDLISSYYRIFQILGLIAFLSALNMLYITLFFPAIKAYNIRMKILVVAGVFHFLLVLLLGNFYDIYGVAISAVVTEFLILLAGYYRYNKTAL